MKKGLIAGLKVMVPLALGIWLVIYFYEKLSPEQRADLFKAFRSADLLWLLLSVFLGWCSHLSRAWRWRYLLGHLGYRTSFFNAYNAVMTGYFMNMVLPRAGEASRAVMLYRAEGVPFEKGFGTILAERAVDMIILLSIAAITLALQLERLELFKERIDNFRFQNQLDRFNGNVDESNSWGIIITSIVILVVLIGLWFVITRPALRFKLRSAARGFLDGLRSVIGTKQKGLFILHTVLIWSLYVAMFWVGFFALPSTASVPFSGVMAGFIAGSVGIVLVQGGIGAYPAFVALIVSVYMAAPEGGVIHPDALAMGWLLWAAQTLMIIVLGGISLLLISRKKAPALA
jgi:uncharacterized protein (TIRG00374 family)